MIRCLPRWRKTGGKCEDNGGDEDLYDDDNGGEDLYDDDNGGGDLYDWCRVIWAEACVAGGGGTGVYLHQVLCTSCTLPPKEHVLAPKVVTTLLHQNMFLHQRFWYSNIKTQH